MDLGPQLVERINDLSVRRIESETEAIARMPGNPLGVEVERDGHIVICTARHDTTMKCNRVMGLRPTDAGSVDSILERVLARGGRCYVEVVPAPPMPPPVLASLARAGLYQHFLMTDLYASAPDEQPCDVRVEPVDANSIGTFIDVFAAGLAGLGFDRRHAEANGPLVDDDAWRLYLAYLGDRPVSVARMFIHEDGAVLSGNITLPDARGKGCQLSLQSRRFADAKAAGVELFTTQISDVGGTSHRNCHRGGMRVAFSRAMWAPLD